MTVTKPDESKEPWSGLTGRIDENFLKNLGFENWDLEITTWWLCGPPTMVQALEEVLDKLEVPQDRRKVEKFSGY